MWKVFGCGLFLGSNCGFIGSNWMPFGENTNPGVTMVQRMLTDWVTLTSGLSTLMPPGALQFSTVTLISQLPGEHGAAPYLEVIHLGERPGHTRKTMPMTGL